MLPLLPLQHGAADADAPAVADAEPSLSRLIEDDPLDVAHHVCPLVQHAAQDLCGHDQA
jgi:hypothetical protein